MNRLFVLAPSAYPLGGVANWLDYLVPGLCRYGWDVVVGLVCGRYHDVDKYVSEHTLTDVVSIDNPTGSREGRLQSIQQLLHKISPQIAMSVNVPDLYFALNRQRTDANSLYSVASLHGLQPEYFSDLKYFGSMIDGVICTNKLTVALAEEKGDIAKERVFYAPYGVKTGKSQKKSRETEIYKILYVGRLDEDQKRVSDLVSIAFKLGNLVSGFRLTIVGTGPDRVALEQAFNNTPLVEKIKFAGPVTASEAYSHYDSADALLITSLWETGPLVAWEAMVRNLPVVTSRYIGSGLEGSLKDGENCLMFDVGDAEAAASCLIRLKYNHALKDQLVIGGHELVQQCYTREASIRAWHQALETIFKKEPLAPCVEPELIKSGRLDHLFGARVGESVRRRLGVQYRHESAGGEWPHSYGAIPEMVEKFWDTAALMDRSCVNLCKKSSRSR